MADTTLTVRPDGHPLDPEERDWSDWGAGSVPHKERRLTARAAGVLGATLTLGAVLFAALVPPATADQATTPDDRAAIGATCFGLQVTHFVPAGGAVFLGTSNDDVIQGTNGADIIHGRGGNDTICGLGGNDTIRGNSGDDVISGGSGNDVLHGGDNNDILHGNDGDDTLHGGKGNDTLLGQGNDDELECGDGSDFADGGAGGVDSTPDCAAPQDFVVNIP